MTFSNRGRTYFVLIVLKYRKESDGGLSAKISKLTIHSMKKKSQRIGMRLSSSLGLVHVVSCCFYLGRIKKERPIYIVFFFND